MERKRLSYRDKLWIAKEEVKDLERLLEEAQRRLNNEYEHIGGRTWYQWWWYMFGWHYD